jgi:orotidine-5'-phosphate decarboxylase
MNPRDRLIVALDVSSASEAQRLVSTVGESVKTFKIGKQLFTAEGPPFVRKLIASGRNVFLDLKFHDIPNTVGGAVRAAAGLGISMLTVHAAGGAAMLRAATDAAAAAPHRPMVLAVTVLTSLSDEDLRQTGISGRVVDQVLRLAALARDHGCGGVVASAQEAPELRRELGAGFAIVTPGVRPAGGDKADQARIVTPAEAIAAGATYLVVGRPITASPDPAAAARRMLDEIAAACLQASM